MITNVDSRAKKTVFCALFFGLLSSFLCSYGRESTTENLDIKEFPAYFSVATWEAIQLANAHSHIGHEKIVAIIDSPVEYIAGLSEKNEGATQAKVEEKIPITRLSAPDPYHGTIVAGLIVGEPRILPCHDENSIAYKSCDKSKMVVTGIAWQIKLINIPDPNTENVADTLKSLLRITKSLTAEETEETKRFSRVIAPTKSIWNFSIVLDHPEKSKRNNLQNIRKHCKENVPASISKKADYLLPTYCIEYIDNNLSLSANSNSVLSSRPKLKANWERNFKAKIDEVVETYYNRLEKITTVVKDSLLSGKNDIIVVVAAGNTGEKLENGNAGLLLELGKNTEGDEPIIGVAAGCGENYIDLCSWSNYGNTVVDILAPGENIPVFFPLESEDGKIVPMATYASGTSFSAPLVAGTAALLAQCKPTAPAKEIIKIIFESARTRTMLEPKIMAGKILDVEEAIRRICNFVPAPYSDKPKRAQDSKETLHDEL